MIATGKEAPQMPENLIGSITAGRHTMWEVVEDSEESYNIVIRSAEDHSKKVEVARTAIPILVDILRKVRNT